MKKSRFMEFIATKILKRLSMFLEQKFLYPVDLEEENVAIFEKIKPYTMTSHLRVNALIESVKYIVQNDIEGAFVECGVWRGGSSMAAMLCLKKMGINSREFYLYDTYSGMTLPTGFDISFTGFDAKRAYEKKVVQQKGLWFASGLDEVKNNIARTKYPLENVSFIKGMVEKTIPETTPEKIALLRLDTDWYESTLHSLEFLFPKLQKNGVLIVDDYGHWAGAKKAVDEYFQKNKIKAFLHRIDYSGRLVIKL